MKKMMIAVATLVLVGCGDNTIYIKHYNADHGGEIEILDNDGAVIASKVVESCGIIMSENRAHVETTEFNIDRDHDNVTVKTPKRGRVDIEVNDGETY